MVRGVNVLGVRGEVGWLVAGEGVPGGGTGGGWAVALCSVRARKEGKKDLGWEGQDAAQQQKMPAVVQSLVLTRWCVDACVIDMYIPTIVMISTYGAIPGLRYTEKL